MDNIINEQELNALRLQLAAMHDKCFNAPQTHNTKELRAWLAGALVYLEGARSTHSGATLVFTPEYMGRVIYEGNTIVSAKNAKALIPTL